MMGRKICAVLVIVVMEMSSAAIQSAALAGQGQSVQFKPKQTIQQFQVAVVLPPGGQLPQGNQPPGPPSSEYVWLQVPVSYLTTPPSVNQPISGAVQPPPRPIVNPSPAQVLPKPPTSSSCLRPRGQFPSNACNKYVNCWDGVAVEQFCPEGLLFSPKGYCDYPSNVDCGGRPTEAMPPPQIETSSFAPTQISSQAPTVTSPATVIVTLPAVDPALRKKCLRPRGQFRSDACNKYVNCWDGVVIEQECPEGLLFSNKGYCDFPGNVQCQNSTAPSRTTPEFDADCPVEFGTFREKLNCSNYFTCIGGKVVARYTCPQGFSFNDNLGVCDYSDRVDCSKEPLIYFPKSNFFANIAPEYLQRISNCQPGTVVPLNQQCTAACLCHDGVSEVVQCPTGLAYNTETDKCVLPQLAKC